MVEKNQHGLYNKAELALIKKTFKDNLELVYALRKFFLQIDLSEAEWILVHKLDKGIAEILRKNIIPHYTDEVPLMQIHDPFVFKEIFNITPDLAFFQIRAKKIVFDYYGQRIAELKGEKVDEDIIYLANLEPSNKVEDEGTTYSNVMARSTIISLIDVRLDEMITFANMPDEESEDEKKERLNKNSNK